MSWKKRRLLVVATLACLLLFSAHRPAHAAAVLANPKATVAVQAKTQTVTVGPIRSGDFSATVAFRVEATSERVHLYLEASDLWLSGDPTDPRKVGPITLNRSRPARIIAQIGRSSHGSHDGASWRGPGDTVSGFQTRKSETIIYESGQGDQFSQDITCKIWYDQPPPVKTAGRYSGVVRLTAVVLPEGNANPPARGHLGPPPVDPVSIQPRRHGPPPVRPVPDDPQHKHAPSGQVSGSDDAHSHVGREGHAEPPAGGRTERHAERHLEGQADSTSTSPPKHGPPRGNPSPDNAQRRQAQPPGKPGPDDAQNGR